MRATIVHLETVTKYFKAGELVNPTAQEKLLNEFSPFMEVEREELRTELEVVSFKNQKELNLKFWEVCEKFKNFLHPNELIIEKC